jgi:DNA-binding response OmpR family regulator
MIERIEGKNILLVEDDALVALTVEDMLLYAKAGAVSVAYTIADALDALATRHFDAAILDLNLNGHMSWPVAQELRRLQVPYLTVTGYGDAVENELIAHLLTKPYSMDELLEAVARLR